MSKKSCKATKSTYVRFCEWRRLNCYLFSFCIHLPRAALQPKKLLLSVYLDSIHFQMVVNSNHQAAPSVNLPRLYEV